MPPREEEEFELVLGNKQLLSLFFVIVVLFAIFFSFGYTLGFGRGQHDRAATIAETDTVPKESEGVRIPDALLKDAPKEPVTAPQGAVPAPARVRNEPAPARSVRPEPETRPKPPPTASRPKPRPAAAGGTGAAVARSIHIQVAAMRVRADAQMLVSKLRAKKYPVALYDQAGDGWHRVVIGPFPNDASAKASQKKLAADGYKTILRRP